MNTEKAQYSHKMMTVREARGKNEPQIIFVGINSDLLLRFYKE